MGNESKVVGVSDFLDVVLHDHAAADVLDIDRHSAAIGRRGRACAAVSGGHAWYSESGNEKHQSGMSTFSIGAWMTAEKLDSTTVLSWIGTAAGLSVVADTLISSGVGDKREPAPWATRPHQ